MINLSVNINKIATLRNARGGNNPNLIQMAKDCERWGANGITVHPRPDERHIRYDDVRELKKVITTEFNIEGNPREQSFIDLVLEIKPTQVTLVPDLANQVTSNQGWDVAKHKDFLSEMAALFTQHQIRVSIFIDPNPDNIIYAKRINTHRVEMYTESYAKDYFLNKEKAIEPFIQTALKANEMGIELNAGHDLDLHNLAYFAKNIPSLQEVSIGHALVCDALYFGMQNSIQMYKRCLAE